MRKPTENIRAFVERRKMLAEKIKGSTLILASPEEEIRNGSVHFPYRQDSNMYFMTGFEEPQAIFVFRPGQKPESVMFVRRKNPERETWDGFRFGPEATKNEFAIDEVYPIEDFESRIVTLLKGSERLYYRFQKNMGMDAEVNSALENLRLSSGRSGFGYLPIFDSDELIGQLRVKKQEAEIHNLRRAAEISAEAHCEVMKYVRPGQNEREIHGYFIYQAYKRGAAREGYNGIVAAGANATTLHYVFNDQALKAGQLLLIDCGAEYNYFTGDITRTYPVSGKFTKAQAEVYQGVLDVNKRIIEMVKPGISLHELQEETVRQLTQLILDLGLLSGRLQDVIETLEYRKYYPHRVGHFLGMDVHDAGLYYDKENRPLPLEEGYTFTVEPGLYIPADDKNAPEEYRGIGVRIEDNILVTRNGCEVMTSAAPKEIADLEKLIGTGP
jgi:Xaa-Pro aminopeptidase